MRVAIIAAPEVNFCSFNRILPKATREILTDGTGPTEQNARLYCTMTETGYREFPPPAPGKTRLTEMMQEADLIILLLHESSPSPGRAIQAATIDKMTHCYYVHENQLFSLIPHQ